jgi:FHA domain
MTTKNVPAKLRKLAFAAGVALGLSVATASVIVAAPQVSTSTGFVDHGGRVLSAARVYPTYWGRYWAPDRVASPTPDQITHALRTVLAGSYQAGLTQYRDIGPAVIHGSRVIATSDPRSQFTNRDIEAFVDALFDAGVLPGPDEQAVYVVTIPPGIDSGEGHELSGEHSYYRRDGHRIHYDWITDSEVLDGATQTTTHEIVETLTDPEGTAILGTPGTCDGERWCEIADICSGGAKLHGVMVKPYWSNIAGHCVTPAPPTVRTCESPSAHACDVASTNSAGPPTRCHRTPRHDQQAPRPRTEAPTQNASRTTCGFGASYLTGGSVMPSEAQLSRLVVIAPDWLAGQVIRIRSIRMTIGRGQTDVYLDDPHVSRLHAALITRDEQLAVEDLGSRSGTTVNGMRVQTSQPLRIGDVVGFGPVVAVVDSDPADSSTAPRTI